MNSCVKFVKTSKNLLNNVMCISPQKIFSPKLKFSPKKKSLSQLKARHFESITNLPTPVTIELPPKTQIQFRHFVQLPKHTPNSTYQQRIELLVYKLEHLPRLILAHLKLYFRLRPNPTNKSNFVAY